MPLDFDPRHPQAAQMADPAMLRTLRFQTEATWPQESRLLARYALPAGARLLDVGCGSGEFVRRLAEAFPGAESITGVDVLPAMLRALGFEHVSVQYLVLDTERVPREGRARFDAALATLRDPEGYAVWQLPVVAGRKPVDGAGAAP
jgi:SAM-dependent methyltransferase